MLFNSFEFIFVFFPLTFLLFWTSARRWGNDVAIAVLVFASLFFYAWWNPAYLFLLVFSMLFNYRIGLSLGKNKRRCLLVLGITTNLGLLGYYKYAGFISSNINWITDTNIDLGNILLPLAISFFTFQQIAYLVDSYQGITKEYSFLHYALFVAFFPQLIAGPIVHHKEMLPQFQQTQRYRIKIDNVIVGLSIFALGLFKKTVIADGIAVHATPIFEAADSGEALDFFAAWGGALAYTFQLYFDFSGYSDMAIGLARMFGIVLPLNFYSPYKAGNIAEFWRRWHMTLSRFLRDYVYIPLGGNRHGQFRRYSNLAATMLLGGLWHGAGWNFVIWGALHGLYLTLHQVWLGTLEYLNIEPKQSKFYNLFAWGTTFLVVVIGWVFFRATSFEGAIGMLEAMSGMQGIAMPNAILAGLGAFGTLLQSFGIEAGNQGGGVFVSTWCWIIFLLFCTLVLPNTQDLFSSNNASLSHLSFEKKSALWPFYNTIRHIKWRDSRKWAIACATALGLGLMTLMQVSEFLYFQF